MAERIATLDLVSKGRVDFGRLALLLLMNGGGGIRTPETIARLTVFKTVAFSRSATPPSAVCFDARRCHSMPGTVGSTGFFGGYVIPIIPIGVRFSAI